MMPNPVAPNITQNTGVKNRNSTGVKQKMSTIVAKSKLKKSFMEFEAQAEAQDKLKVQQFASIPINAQNYDFTDPNSRTSKKQIVSKKHIRANSSANYYNGTHLANGQLYTSQSNGGVQRGAGAVGAAKPVVGGSMVSTDMTNIGLNGRLARDNLNITNSLIISNS